MALTISICKWEDFQHYKDRDPPWIKLYRNTFTTEVWVLGTDLSRLLQLASTLLAARYKNEIPLNFKLISKVVSLDCVEEQFHAAIAYLASHKFLKINGEADVPQLSASTALATCSTERETEESRGRVETDPSASSTPTKSRVRKVPRETEDPEWFLDFKLAYPSRAGDQGWRKAIRAAHARMAEGHTAAEFIAGAARYAAFIAATGKENTEFVKQACTFLGPDKHFLLPWTPPAQAESAVEEILRLNGEKPHGTGRIFDAEQGQPALEAPDGSVRSRAA